MIIDVVLSVAIVVAVILTRALTRASYSAKVGASEATTAQIRAQLDKTEGELRGLRSELACERQARTKAETTLNEEQKSIAAQKEILAEAQQKLVAAFEGLAAQALASNNTRFLELASREFDSLRTGAVAELQNKITPLSETLNRYQQALHEVEGQRQKAYGELTSTLVSVKDAQDFLRQETSNLVSALRRPNVRGRWGELTLRRVAEMTGMSSHCDFDEQSTIESAEGRLRPDMVIHLPKDVDVPVDAKVPSDAYLDALSASSDQDRDRHLDQYASAVKERIRTLSSKDYAAQFKNTPNVTVLFLPSEGFLAAALDRDRSLLEYAMERKVLLATPVSLFGLLKAVALGWQQDALSRNAEAIRDLGKEMYDRIASVWSHLDNARSNLAKTVQAFDEAVGSLNRRLLPSAQKFKDLGVTNAEDIQPIEDISRVPRALNVLGSPPEAEQKELPLDKKRALGAGGS